MKTSIKILLLAVALLTVQACGRRAEKEEADKAAELAEIKSPAETAVASPTPEERRIAAEKKRAVLAEKQKAAWDARVKSPTYKDVDGNLIYNKAEQDPTFNGGERAMNTYFRDNVKFPEDAAKEGLDGTVYVEFVIASNGRVGEVKAAEIPGEEVDQRFVDEAVRVVKAMPNWIPGRQHGKPVAVSFSVPVTFEIQG